MAIDISLLDLTKFSYRYRASLEVMCKHGSIQFPRLDSLLCRGLVCLMLAHFMWKGEVFLILLWKKDRRQKTPKSNNNKKTPPKHFVLWQNLQVIKNFSLVFQGGFWRGFATLLYQELVLPLPTEKIDRCHWFRGLLKVRTT